jgi:type I restriction enzyme R subunit
MGLNEAETRVRLIDPALHARGWREGMIAREETAGAIEIVDGQPQRHRPGRADYVLRVPVFPDGQPVALAVIEAKSEELPPGHGLQQAKLYADAKRLNVPFVFASNGHQFVLYERFHGTTSPPRLLAEFPTPADLRVRYEAGMGFSLADEAAKPLSIRYVGGDASRRYYQDAAIRAVLEAIAQGQNRALL